MGMEELSFWQYHRKVFSKSTNKVIRITEIVSFILAVILGIVTRFCPKLGGAMNALLWAIPLAVFIATGFIEFMSCSYSLYKKAERERNDAYSHILELESKSPNIKVEHAVYHSDYALLKITNSGASAIFTARANVVSGISAPKSYGMCWESPNERGNLNKGDTATISVAEISKTTALMADPSLSIYKGGLTLFSRDEIDKQRFGMTSPETIEQRNLNEMYSTMATPLEDKCVIEVTLTANPPLLEPFENRRYSLEIDAARTLCFTPLPERETDKEGYQTL